MKTNKTVLGAALATAVLAFVPANAHADGGIGSGAYSASNAVVAQQTPTSSKDGGATVKANISWQSSKSATVSGSYDDLCPRDPDHAYLTVRAKTSEGTVVKRFADTAPCANKAKGFQVSLTALTRRVVHSVRVEICESRTLSASVAQCVIKNYDNPRDTSR